MRYDVDTPMTGQVDVFGSVVTENVNKPRTFSMSFIIPGDSWRSTFTCVAYNEKQAISYMKKVFRDRKIYKIYDLEVTSQS